MTSNGQPLYLKVAEEIRQTIATGGFEGGKLPAQDELAARYKVSQGTVHRAIAHLRKEGDVYTTHAGTFASKESGEA